MEPVRAAAPAGAASALRSEPGAPGLRRCSSWRIELQISMHSLQMYTPGGPAMRDATWWRGFSQKVQRSTWRPVRLDELMRESLGPPFLVGGSIMRNGDRERTWIRSRCER